MRRLPTTFLDVILTVLLVCVVLVKKEEAEDNLKPRAFFICEVTWKDVKQDVDLWAMRVGVPKSRTGFPRREIENLTLHGDHTGSRTGLVDDEGNEYALETITMDSLMPGEYAFSLHGYRASQPTTANVTLIATRPYRVVFQKTIDVEHGQEHHIVRIRINQGGNVEEVLELPIPILRNRQ